MVNIECSETDDCYKLLIENFKSNMVEGKEINDHILNFKDKNKTIELYLKDSYLITSSIIGYLLKKVGADGFNVVLKVDNPETYKTLETLNLIKVFNVVLIEK